ncbi:hypothetical protein N7492_004180 [Penicillium capsulatum]|uniref:Zinc-ribbon domain-containing protein n=1 Tax=Penicillium capsulatum TaxID=69766 RepID=A0A9W9LX92_9EURO|nr:hypothetical protein N7492_004180 [Penicillium capsulatum]KAJ6121250.1 hypothetical protein N7512_003715 [Penicillium capsulatum]
MQQFPGATRASRLNKWWPIGFFIGAVACFIIGGALIGSYVSSSVGDCSYNSYYSSYYDNYSCSSGNTGLFYGGIAMFVIGGVVKLTAWILLILFCVKRHRSNQPTVTYINAPPAHQPYAAPQPIYQAAPFSAPVSPNPVSTEMANLSVAGTPPPKEANATATATAFKFCGNCGATVSSRFCPQCGAQN